MNFSLFSIFFIISIIGLLLFWWFYRRSNSLHKHTQQYLLTALNDPDLNEQQQQNYQQQLSQNLIENKQQSGTMLIFVATLLVVPSYIFYLSLGNPEAINHTPQISQQNQAPQMSMEEAINKLEQRLKDNPNDLEGQMLYARSQASIQNFGNAVTAYRKANELAPNESVILTELAEAIAMFNNNRSFLGEPAELLQQAVNIDANNEKALWLLGMTFYERKDFAKTNELWTRLYDLMNNDNAKAQLQQQLDDVRAQLNDGQHRVMLSITLDDSLKAKLEGKNALLYVYSKATSGMPMPIAVHRQALNNQQKWPITVTLSDTNNLQAQRKLSDFEQVTIGARISFSGQAIAQSGDLQSVEVSVKVAKSDNVELLINQIK